MARSGFGAWIVGLWVSGWFSAGAQSGDVQKILLNSLSGHVKNAETGQPVWGANVFLSNTTIGTVTDPTGDFRIENIPPGMYNLVIQHVGFGLKIQSVEPEAGSDIRVNVSMEPRVLTAREVRVVAPVPKEWRKRLKEFEKMFFGFTKNAERCRLLNPQVLDFKRDSVGGLWSASTDSALLVENASLGYRITNFIDSFTWTPESVHYRVYSIFRPLPSQDLKGQEAWTKSREQTYRGSLRHFFSAIARQRVEQEGFRLFDGDLGRLKRGLGRTLAADSLYAALKDAVVIYDEGSDPSSQKTEYPDTPSLKLFTWPKWLRVEYITGSRGTRSYFRLKNDPALLDGYGNIRNASGYTVDGLWARSRLADELPLDYSP